MKDTDLKIWTGQKLNESTPEIIMTTIQNCCMLYYGIYSSNIPDVLLKEAIKKLLVKYPTITLHEIKHSFDRLTPPDKPKITLMLSDIIDPITKYIYVKNFISDEAVKLTIKKAVKDRIDNREQIFIEESLSIYKDSMKKGIWEGDIFHANAIAKDYLAKHIPQEVKDIMWIEAKKECKRIKNNPAILIDNMAITPIRLFAQKIVITSIELGIDI